MKAQFKWYGLSTIRKVTQAIIFSNICFSDNVCGKSAIPPVLNSKNRKRIIGGMEVVANAWPWQAYLSLGFYGLSLLTSNCSPYSN